MTWRNSSWLETRSNLVGALWSGIEDTAHVKFGGDLHFQLGSLFIIKSHDPYFT